MLDCSSEYRQRLSQARRCVGELEVLKALHFEPLHEGGGDLYVEARKVIDYLIEEIVNNFC